MSYLSIRPFSIALCCLIGAGLGGCVAGPGYYSGAYVYSGPPATVGYYNYWYYPGAGIYYDFQRHVYFYPRNGSWVRVRELPPPMKARLGRHVIIHSRHDRPYLDYDNHRRSYPQNYYAPPVKKIPDQQRYRPQYDQQRYQPQYEQRRYQPQYDRQDVRRNDRRDNRRNERDYQQYERTNRYQPGPSKHAPQNNKKENERKSSRAKEHTKSSNKSDRNDRKRRDDKSQRNDRQNQDQRYLDAPSKY